MVKLIALSIAFVLTACAGTPIDWDKARKLHLGMTEIEVTNQLGKPYIVSSRADGAQIWIWSFAAAMGGAESLSVTMKDGKTVEVPKIPASFH